MKLYLIYYFLLFLIVHNQGLGQCLQNGDFTTSTCGNESDPNSCLYFTSACLPNWHVSNGTPQRLGTTDPYLFMWAEYHYSGKGEGIFAGYNFTPGTAYSFKIRAKANGGPGGFNVYATTGLNDNPSSGAAGECGGALPTVSALQSIKTLTPTEEWAEFEVYFVANYTWTQLWISPYNTTNAQYNLYIDWVNVCNSSCATLTGTAYFNQGELSTYASGAIYAGSSSYPGGSGTVTVNGTSNTILTASDNTNGIVLFPDFEAIVSSGSFKANIIPYCDNSITRKNKGEFIDPKFPLTDERAGLKDSLVMAAKNVSFTSRKKTTVYPVPSTGRITVDGTSEELANAVITVTDLSGKQVFLMADKGNAIPTSLDLSKLSNGVYLLKIKTSNKSVTKKIIINK